MTVKRLKTVISTDQDTLLAMLNRRHPEYWALLSHWDFCESTYRGGRSWFLNNVFKYLKEGDEEYRQRVERAYRFNHTKEVVDLIQKYIFKSDIARNVDDASDEVKAFWKNATLGGLNIDSLMRVIGAMSSVFGRIWAFVDTNKTISTLSIADQKKSGQRAYAYFVKPHDVFDYRWADDGSVDWVLLRESVRDDTDPFGGTGRVDYRYRLWTKTDWFLFRVEEVKSGDTAVQSFAETNEIIRQLIDSAPVPSVAKAISAETQFQVILVDQGANPLGVVPGRPVDHVVGDNRYAAPGLIDDVAYLDRATANYLSNLDAIIQDQTFSQLAMPAQGIPEGDDPYDKLREMGTRRIFTYDGEGQGKPFFISPDVKQAGLIMEVVNKVINEIYSTVGAAGERTKQDNSVGIDNSSGVAKAYDFERLNSLLTTKSESLSNCENWLVEMVELWNGKQSPKDALVSYPDTFDVRSLYDEFTVAERLILMEAPDDVRREQMKQVIAKLFPALKADIKADMLDDLADWPLPDPADAITGTTNGDPTSKFPGSIKVTLGPQATGAPGAKPAKTPKAKKPTKTKDQNRQGQVTKNTP